MLAADRIHFLLYGVGCLWSLLVWTVAAGLVGKWNSTVGYGYRYVSFDSANAVLAWGLLTWLYYTAALVVLMFISSANIFLCIIADVCFLGFFLIFGFGAVGALSSVAAGFRALTSYSETSSIGSLGQATLALGWLLVFLILGTLVFEVYYVLRNYGGQLGEWRQSFHDLTTGGSGLRSEKPAPAAGVVTQSAV